MVGCVLRVALLPHFAQDLPGTAIPATPPRNGATSIDWIYIIIRPLSAYPFGVGRAATI
jgi:hypothetical protein